MEINTHRFDLPTQPRKSIIKVIGVGGGGSNAVNNMHKHGIQDVDFIVCNTDEQALKSSPIKQKLQIGINLTSGLGAGANPEVGKNAALESKEEIETLLNDGTKMLFVTAGMGGGTGTGAAPVIANIASKIGILTVGIVTLPFSFEGKRKLSQAQKGIHELKQYCDTVLVILNDRLREVLGNLSIGNAFAQADNVLTTAAKSIAEIITVPGYVNVDFEDVKTVMKKAGAAVMGSAQAEGEGRARKAAELALTSPLLDYKDIHGAKKILLSIVSGQEAEMQMDELAVITDYIQEKVGEDAEMIFGHGSDKQLKESIRVTVIATGFEDNPEKLATTTVPKSSSINTRPKQNLANNLPRQGYLFEGFGPNTGIAQDVSNNLYGTTKREKMVSVSGINAARTNSVIDKENDYELQTNLPFGMQHVANSNTASTNYIKRGAQKLLASELTEEVLREYLEVPAYIRQAIRLQDLPNVPADEVVRHHLDITGCNARDKDDVN